MLKLRAVLALMAVMVALLVGSGVASAGVMWCEVGCPPPIESGLVQSPDVQNGRGLPTPQFTNPNGKFDNSLPPGMAKAAK